MLRLLACAVLAGSVSAKRLHVASSIDWNARIRADGSELAQAEAGAVGDAANMMKSGDGWTPLVVQAVPDDGKSKGIFGFALLGAAVRLTLVLIVGIILVYLLARSRNRPPPSPYVSKGLLSHLRVRLGCEWHVIRVRMFPEWLLIAIFLAYITTHVVRALIAVRHRQVVDYIPESWCAAIGSSPLHPAGWKAGDTCAEHANALDNFGGLSDAVRDFFPSGVHLGNLKRSPEILQGIIGILVSSVVIVGCLLREPGARGNRPYLASILTRALRVLTFTIAVHSMISLSTSLPSAASECVGAHAATGYPTSWWQYFYYPPSPTNPDCSYLLYSWELPVVTVMLCTFFHYGEKLLEPETYLYHWGRIVLTVLFLAQSLLVVLLHDKYTSDLLVVALIATMSWRLYDHEFGEDLTPHHFLPAYTEAAAQPREAAQRDRAAKLLAMTDEQFAQHTLFEGSVAGFVFLLLIAVSFLGMTTATLVTVFAK